MINFDVNTANAYVVYRTDMLAEHQKNLHRKENKPGKAGLKRLKRILR